MLIDKGVLIGEVITLKLTSGEELVAKLTEEKDSYYKYKGGLEKVNSIYYYYNIFSF